jgi:hypothetical protein
MTKTIHRRRVLRGMLGGTAIAVGLPFLECFLNTNGTALADGAPMPVRFGTWFWGLGMNKTIFTPEKSGANFDLKPELAPIRSVQQHINLYSHFRISTDGRPSLCHYTGWVVLRCGQAPMDRESVPGESIDVTVADALGGGTRFRSLELTATGDKRNSFSFRSARAVNPPEISPVNFYRRVFGAEFQDPNSSHFQPNPELLLRKSVLSAVKEDSAQLRKSLGAADRDRLDQYFTSLRGLEQRLELQLQKPAPAPSCRIPPAEPREVTEGMDAELVAERHKLMTDILVAALACNQTRIFNMSYSSSFAGTTRTGTPSTHHTITHEEVVNAHGYQETHSWFVSRAMESWAYFVGSLAAVREGDRTLLDNTLVFAHSDQETAKIHSMDGIPMMSAGNAGGRLKTGLHIDGRNEALATQVGLTMLRAVGLNLQEWGKGSMRETKSIDSILV